LCKRLRKDTQRLKEQKTKLEGMVEPHDELIMEITKGTRLDSMGEDVEDEDKDDDDSGDAAAPPTAAPSPVPTPPVTATREVIIIKDEDPMEMVPKKEDPMVHEVILVDGKSELPKPRLYCTLMRDHEESPSRMLEDPHELDNPTEADYDVDEWYPEDDSNDRDLLIEFKSLSLSLGIN
jgi:hypothetical protein